MPLWRQKEFLRHDKLRDMKIRKIASMTGYRSLLKRWFRIRVAKHGCSLAKEVRRILRSAVNQPPAKTTNLARTIRERIAPLGGVDLELPSRKSKRKPPKFD